MANTLITEDRKVIDDVCKHFVTVPDPVNRMDAIISNIRMQHHNNRLAHTAWAHTFLLIGSCAKTALGDKFNQDKFVALVQQKSKAYGDAPIRSWGPLGVIIRIDSKMLRYQNIKQKGTHDDEDTLLDIIGYAVLGYRLVTEER